MDQIHTTKSMKFNTPRKFLCVRYIHTLNFLKVNFPYKHIMADEVTALKCTQQVFITSEISTEVE